MMIPVRPAAVLVTVMHLLAPMQPAAADCPAASARIADIVATDPALDEGEAVRVRGVITGDFRGDDALRGFFLQSRAPGSDSLPRGMFVFTPDHEPDDGDFGPGSEVLVSGTVTEYRDRRQVGWVESIETCSEPGLPEPATLPLSVSDRADWSRLAGLRVRLPGPATVTGNFDLARYGTLAIAAGERLFQTTQFDAPGPTPDNARRLLLDDGSYTRDRRPVPFLDADGTRRIGSVIPELTGVLAHAFGAWRIHPLATDAVVFEPANPRPSAPAPPPDTVRVVGFNVDNYFLTPGERGASDEAERDRQRRQLRSVMAGLRPAILGVVEVENRPQAVADLVRHVGAATGNGRYRHFELDEPVGTDAIRVALAWDPERAELIAGPFIDEDPVHRRPPIAGHFRLADDGPGTLVVVIHHKAKGNCPDADDEPANVDRGQGCWNALRTAQSRALARFLAAQRARTGAERVLIIGDINSYGAEDPVAELRAAGFGDLLRRLPRDRRYTHVYRGESGTLDTALASPALADDVEAVAIWHVNADEPPDLQAFSPTTGPWRSSDHDPVIVDISTGGN